MLWEGGWGGGGGGGKDGGGEGGVGGGVWELAEGKGGGNILGDAQCGKLKNTRSQRRVKSASLFRQ